MERKPAIAAVGVFTVMSLVASVARAGSGQVTVQGSVGGFLALSVAQIAAGNGTRVGARQNGMTGAEAQIVFQRDGADLSRTLGATVTLMIRGNVAYTLAAEVTEHSAELQNLPVRMGLHNVRASGDGLRVRPEALSGTHPVGDFAGNPLASLSEGVQVARFGSGPTTILAGTAASSGGTLTTPNNAVLVDSSFGAPPSMLDSQEEVALTVAYTLATP